MECQKGILNEITTSKAAHHLHWTGATEVNFD